MFEKTTLGNTGIEVLDKLEDGKIIDIVNQVSTRLMVAFPDSNLSYLDIYKTLLDTPMYYAKIPEGLSKANYYYKDSSIYFAEDADLSEIDEYVLHECVHKLQERKDKKGNITRLGISEVNELSVKATALNEGAIQYVTSNAFNMSTKMVTVYGIELPSKTEYYPIITNLVSQLAFLLGKDILIDSTINGNEDFKIEIIDNIGESEYNTIEKNTNAILQAKRDISKLQKQDMTDEEIEKVEENIGLIRELYFDTQNTIFTSYFNNLFKRIEDEVDIKVVRRKLETYKNLIGTTTNYYYFDNYCTNFYRKLDNKSQEIKNRTPLMVIKNNIFFRVLRKIRQFFSSKTGDNQIK